MELISGFLEKEEEETEREKKIEKIKSEIISQQKLMMQQPKVTNKIVLSSKKGGEEEKQKEKQRKYQGKEENIFSLGFVSLSTNPIEKFEIRSAAKILAIFLIQFLNEFSTNENLRVYLFEKNEEMVEKLEDYLGRLFKQNNLPFDSRFKIIQSEKKLLKSCRFLVLPINWRFKCRGLFSKSVADTLNLCPSLENIKKLHLTAPTGKTFSVQLDASTDDHPATEVEYVLLIHSPNRNPDKPDCITDSKIANDLLEKCYKNIFDEFVKLANLS